MLSRYQQMEAIVRRTSLPHLQERMRYTVRIRSNPVHERGYASNDRSDGIAIYNAVKATPADSLITARCERSMAGNRTQQGGSIGVDDYMRVWSIIIPGGLPGNVYPGMVAIIDEDDDPLVYTVRDVAVDRLQMMARLTLEEYGSRR